MFRRGDTQGVYRFESVGMQERLKECRPQSISELAALYAMYRPGILDNIPTYIANKNNLDKINYLFEELKDILKETYGVMVYQEQVAEIIHNFGCYSMEEADNLRRILSKKRLERYPEEKEKFIASSVKNGKTKERASAILDYLGQFAGLCYPKSNAVGDVIVAYQMAYLKAHYPKEYEQVNP